ncbi:Acyl-CoA synthetase member 3, mitochondrial [Gaertneriomyces sp. JEL0708]|nr:Acyl-CoA synthetase member 3, mitochondrial [Gaertneriomyces sp. JEL0708]
MAHVYNEMSPEQQTEAKAACAQFRLMVSGSAALPETVFKEWEGISGHKLLERYGMTEIGMGLGNPYEGPRIPGTVGVPFPGVEARIVSENGVDVTNNPGESGELLIRGPQVFKEYWNRREATQEAKVDDWFRTGDIVLRDQSGVFKILGRASQDIIKTGGYKISALEIERELLDDSRIQDAAVVGLPSEEWGEIVGAVVVFKKASGCSVEACTDPLVLTLWLSLQNVVQRPDLREIQAFLRKRLANYKIPRMLKVVEHMPRNPMGKVNKKELRKIFAPMKE